MVSVLDWKALTLILNCRCSLVGRDTRTDRRLHLLVVSLLALSAALVAEAAVIKFAGVPDDSSLATAWHNGALLNKTLLALRPGDELVFAPKTTYYLMGGIMAANLSNNVIRFEGTLVFSDDTEAWPRTGTGHVLECLSFNNISNVTFTSSTVGLLDGHGETWWGFIGYLDYAENRPRLLSIGHSRDLLIENIYFKSSPYWTVWIYDVDGLEIRHSEISNRRDNYDGHDIYNLGYVPLLVVSLSLLLLSSDADSER